MNFRICLYVSAVAMLATSCDQQKTDLVLDENLPDQTMKNATIQHTDSGRLQMIMWGEEIWNFDDEDETQEFPKSVKATFYSETGKITTIITADEGTNWQKKKLMNLRKNVVIRNFRDGKTTYTEDFYWNQETGRIYSNVRVMQVDKYGKTWGDGFESDENMEQFEMIRPRMDRMIGQ